MLSISDTYSGLKIYGQNILFWLTKKRWFFKNLKKLKKTIFTIFLKTLNKSIRIKKCYRFLILTQDWKFMVKISFSGLRKKRWFFKNLKKLKKTIFTIFLKTLNKSIRIKKCYRFLILTQDWKFMVKISFSGLRKKRWFFKNLKKLKKTIFTIFLKTLNKSIRIKKCYRFLILTQDWKFMVKISFSGLRKKRWFFKNLKKLKKTIFTIFLKTLNKSIRIKKCYRFLILTQDWKFMVKISFSGLRKKRWFFKNLKKLKKTIFTIFLKTLNKSIRIKKCYRFLILTQDWKFMVKISFSGLRKKRWFFKNLKKLKKTIFTIFLKTLNKSIRIKKCYRFLILTQDWKFMVKISFSGLRKKRWFFKNLKKLKKTIFTIFLKTLNKSIRIKKCYRFLILTQDWKFMVKISFSGLRKKRWFFKNLKKLKKTIFTIFLKTLNKSIRIKKCYRFLILTQDWKFMVKISFSGLRKKRWFFKNLKKLKKTIFTIFLKTLNKSIRIKKCYRFLILTQDWKFMVKISFSGLRKKRWFFKNLKKLKKTIFTIFLKTLNKSIRIKKCYRFLILTQDWKFMVKISFSGLRKKRWFFKNLKKLKKTIFTIFLKTLNKSIRIKKCYRFLILTQDWKFMVKISFSGLRKKRWFFKNLKKLKKTIFTIFLKTLNKSIRIKKCYRFLILTQDWKFMVKISFSGLRKKRWFFKNLKKLKKTIFTVFLKTLNKSIRIKKCYRFLILTQDWKFMVKISFSGLRKKRWFFKNLKK